jgi:hypothetical protein
MKYSTPFLQQAALAARGDLPAAHWLRLPIGQRVSAIYQAIQRIESDHATARRAGADNQADAREKERMPAD